MCSSATRVKCRPPGNRDPHPNEIESCNEYLRRQVELIQPTVICTLGNFSTKLLRGDNTGISRLHGQPEVRTIGARAIRLYPLYHPAAALYTPSTLEMLRADFSRIPDLLAQGAPEQPAVADEDGRPADEAPPQPADEAPAATRRRNPPTSPPSLMHQNQVVPLARRRKPSSSGCSRSRSVGLRRP